ncbi:MAG TPA: hypothetical protein VJ859_06190, partial [Allosphingosinicella sp.]|nr:hypothetical protein [Allosphingosinicella sp.]
MSDARIMSRPSPAQGGAPETLQRIIAAPEPLTLSGVPTGFLPWLAADLARAAKGRALFIAPDEAEMRHLADAAHFFAPELETLVFPAWD